MEQTNIYHYLGLESDPIFNIISRLQRGQVIDVGGATLTLNNSGLFELESESYHECFRSEQEVYDGLSKLF